MGSTEEFIAAGLYDPVEPAHAGRLELLEWLIEQDFTVDDMGAAQQADSLGAMAGDRRLVPDERLSHVAAVAASGLSDDDFDAYARVFGFVPITGAPPGELGVTKSEAQTFALFGALATMFSQEEALAILRVVGSSLSRIADASVSLFLADVESVMLTDGSSELDLAKSVYEVVGLLDGFAAQLDPVLRRHVLQAIERSRQSTISMEERFQYRYAVGFVDLVGFTEVSADMAPRELASFLREFEGRAYDTATAFGARVVKLIGDEVMFVATDAGAACQTASALMTGFGVDERVLPRGGLAYGNVLVRGGDFYGSVVNLASRLVNEAVPQELLVTEELALASDSCSFEPAGRRMVKGFAEPITVRSLVST